MRSRAFTTCLRNEQRDLRYKKHKKNPKDKEDKKHSKMDKKHNKGSSSSSSSSAGGVQGVDVLVEGGQRKDLVQGDGGRGERGGREVVEEGEARERDAAAGRGGRVEERP